MPARTPSKTGNNTGNKSDNKKRKRRQNAFGHGPIAVVAEKLELVGRMSEFLGRALAAIVRPPYRIRNFTEQFERIGVRSVPIITLSGAAIGMIFSLQTVSVLAMFSAETMVGAAVGLTMARELAPVVTTLMLIAKNGSAMTAELGTMRVTEQLDAMETMGVDPIQYLVAPRVMAAMITFPILTALANVVGIVGSYLVATSVKGVDPGGFLQQLYWFVNPLDIGAGLFKAAIMGFMMAVICSFYGFFSSGGARGVGESATRAVVTSSVSILVVDYILADIMIKLFHW